MKSSGFRGARRRTPGTQTTAIRREGNIHRLTDRRDSDDDENNTWNGNSTQQMWYVIFKKVYFRCLELQPPTHCNMLKTKGLNCRVLIMCFNFVLATFKITYRINVLFIYLVCIGCMNSSFVFTKMYCWIKNWSLKICSFNIIVYWHSLVCHITKFCYSVVFIPSCIYFPCYSDFLTGFHYAEKLFIFTIFRCFCRIVKSNC